MMHELKQEIKTSGSIFLRRHLQMEHTLSWVIDNFSEKNDEIRTANFSISGCEW